MKINRAWLGGSEEIDLGTPEGFRYFHEEVVQGDLQVAEYYISRLADEFEVMVNVEEPEYLERWTVLFA